MSHVVIYLDSTKVIALHVQEEIVPNLVVMDVRTTFVNGIINNPDQDFDYGDLVTVQKIEPLDQAENDLFAKLGCNHVATEVHLTKKVPLSIVNMFVIKTLKSRKHVTGAILANPTTNEELEITVYNEKEVFKGNVRDGSIVSVTMNIQEPRARLNQEFGIVIPHYLTTDIILPTKPTPKASIFIKGFRLCGKEETMSLELEGDTEEGWKKLGTVLRTSATTVCLAEKLEIEETKMSDMTAEITIVFGNVTIWFSRKNLPEMAWRRAIAKYAKDAVVTVKRFMPTMARLTARIAETDHKPCEVNFAVKMKVGTLLRALNHDGIDTIPKENWHAKIVPQMQIPQGFLNKLESASLPILSQPNSMAKEIVKALLGATTTVRTDDEIYEGPVLPEFLTAEQADVIESALDGSKHTIIIQAPAGSGKSTTLTYMIKSMMESRCCDTPICITAQTNQSVMHLLAEVMITNPEHDVQALLLPSTFAFKNSSVEESKIGAKYDFRNRLIELVHSGIGEPENTMLKQAIQILDSGRNDPDVVEDPEDGEIAENEPRNTEEKETLEEALKILLQNMPITIIAGTVAMLTKYVQVLKDKVTTLVIDECSTVRLLEAIYMVSQLTRLNKLIAVGDNAQLGSYTGNIPEQCIELGYNSTLQQASKATGAGVKQLRLTWVHRFHPKLAEFLSKISYEGQLQTTVREQDRSLMDQVMGYHVPVPIIFVNVKGMEEKVLPTSKTNLQQSVAAIWIANHIRSKAPEASITLLTYYNGQRSQLEEMLEDKSISVSSIEKMQGKESDAIVLVTTSVDSVSTFLDDMQRLTVALSRSRCLCFVVAHKGTMKAMRNWKKVVLELEEIGNEAPLQALKEAAGQVA